MDRFEIVRNLLNESRIVREKEYTVKTEAEKQVCWRRLYIILIPCQRVMA